jgi:LPS-assembly protein
MSRIFPGLLVCAFLLLPGAKSFAQVLNISGYTIVARSQDRLTDKHLLLVGDVELKREGTELYAEQVEFFEEEDRALATGNVVLIQGNNRIAADRAEFNTKTGLGTFYHASGIASLQSNRRSPSPLAGPAVPQMIGASQDTDIYFFGDIVEKQGAKKYKISNGGFTACVQPTKRWELSADSIVLNIDHYTFIRQAILRVKDVPMLYLPALYYPTQEDGRATGFLLPTYSSSTLRGHSVSVPFFWAIDRSQDATFFYDYFSKTGGGAGSEYRYNRGGGSDGNLTFYALNEHDTTYVLNDGSEQLQPGARWYQLRGSAHHTLPGNLRAVARVDYFSNFGANQTFSTNYATTTNNNSSYGANVVGSWHSVFLNGTYEHNQYFYSNSSSSINGSSPRISVTRSDRPLIPNSRLFFGFTSEIAHLDRQTVVDNDVTPLNNHSVGRFDFSPTIRYPFTRWQWFTINSSLVGHETFYTRSLDPSQPDPNTGQPFVPIDQALNRDYFTVGVQTIGPVFTRVWDTPNSQYATRIKHSIEPFFTAQRSSGIPERDRILQVDSTDSVYGDTTSLTYGLTNRIYAKRKTGSFASAQEIVNVSIAQAYYTDARASLVDPRSSTSYTTTTPNNFSPITIAVRGMPTNTLQGNLQAEIDSHYRELRSMNINASYNWQRYGQASVGWSKRFFIEGLSGFNDPGFLGNGINLATNLHTLDNKYGTSYSANYDILHSTLVQQRLSFFYNAQCCGAAAEYQVYNYPSSVSPIPADHRFFLSVTLAGLGNFSPFNGGLMGVPR